MRTLTILTAATATLALAGGLFAAAKTPTIWDGVYTEQQAKAGAARYAQQCARCHGPELYGTTEVPSLRGQLIARYGNTGLGTLFTYIHTAMPMQSPGALPPAANAEILAHILKINGAPAGAAALSADPTELNRVLITAQPTGIKRD